MNDEKPISQSQLDDDSTSTPVKSHGIATGLGAAGGGIAGVAIGESVAGKIGAVVGGVAGAIVGSIAAESLLSLAEDANESLGLGLGLGADTKEIELPQHYSWEELQALSKPQREQG